MKTVDRYEGCLPEITDALRAGLVCQDVWVWYEPSGFSDGIVAQTTIVDYIAGTPNPYKGVDRPWSHASPTDPRIPAKPKWTYPDAGPDTPVDTPVWCRNLPFDKWLPRHADGKGGAFYSGATSFSTDGSSSPWIQMALADPDNLRVPPPLDR